MSQHKSRSWSIVRHGDFHAEIIGRDCVGGDNLVVLCPVNQADELLAELGSLYDLRAQHADLLAACKALVDETGSLMFDRQGVRRVARAARAAIARAEGGGA